MQDALMHQKFPSSQGFQSLWVKLIESPKLCLGCLTTGHGRVTLSCPYKEERVDVCKRPACKAIHHYLLHVEKPQAKTRQRERPPAMTINAAPEPTQTGEQGSAVPLASQCVKTREGEPYLVFWDTGSQVTLTTHKAAQAMKLQAIPSTPLNFEGIVDVCCSRATVHYKVPLVNTGGMVILVTAYGIQYIMSPLGGGDMAPMKETFPEVPAGGLFTATGEVSLLMGQDNLRLFPSEWRRVGNAGL
jgi:hypothetical protein